MAPRSSRLTRHKLRYEPTLRTDSQYEVELLTFFAKHRIATTDAVQAAFPAWFRYNSTVMPHLHWLANRQWLKRHGDRRTGYLWNITNKGYTRCRDSDFRKYLPLSLIPSEYREPKGRQAEHDALITRTAASIYGYLDGSNHARLLQDGRYMLRSFEWKENVYDPSESPVHPFREIEPDYWYVSSDGNGMMIRFVEVVAGENSSAQVKAKYREYLRWSLQPDNQRFLIGTYRRWGATGDPIPPTFELHLILESRDWHYTDEWKERMAWGQILDQDDSIIDRTWTTTKERFDEALAMGKTINDAQWKRNRRREDHS